MRLGARVGHRCAGLHDRMMRGLNVGRIELAFCADLRERVANRPEISSDAFAAYPWASDLAFGVDVDYGQIVKTYHGEPAIDAARRYSPGYVVAVQKTPIVGRPPKISTSLVERQNLRVRCETTAAIF